jgi:hypothetical protein
MNSLAVESLAAAERGGRRRGAGRPRTVGWVPRKRRPDFPDRYPLQVTLRVRKEVGDLRREEIFAAIQRAFLKGHTRFGMRMAIFAIESDQLLLVSEADNRLSLARGIQGLSVRMARGINAVLGRKGKVFADRYQARVMKTACDVRDTVEAVHEHHRRLLESSGQEVHPFYIDPYSSMSGRACTYMHDYDRSEPVIAEPKTWLLRFALAMPSILMN